jgi:hypothetical protein
VFASGRARPHIEGMTYKPKTPRDANQLAKFIVDVATGEASDDTPEKAEAQQRGGKKGGVSRAANLTPEERSAIAKKAATARRRKTARLPGPLSFRLRAESSLNDTSSCQSRAFSMAQ